ncbi:MULTISPECIES: hypothetical protein [unclassified Arcicella]|uniref:hypothetical protein n=1 Tax=unclassified Arcicella TaxID=2644986 RepID=UPI0028555558|nr:MULTISPECIES: hypothetical protein [unclassified Arcicella]MDR6562056.1 hypothetical protein [Arcicella sp. BE51]MDR6811928.1 hypothetical protein [Arcicella sp. BE140]MDR6822958.1 hypothetical protein [Arcicella sp. BE139]
MKATITSFSTRFIGLIPPLVILLITVISNPDLFKKKQQNKLKAINSYQVSNQNKQYN